MLARTSMLARLAVVVVVFSSCRAPTGGQSNLTDGPIAVSSQDFAHQLVFGQGGNAEGLSAGTGESRYVKFVYTLSDNKVWYQNSTKFKFHYDGASANIPLFANVTAAQFDALTLRNEGRKAVSGTVLFRFVGEKLDVALQIVGAEPIPSDASIAYLKAVRATITGSIVSAGTSYFPTFEQAAKAQADAALYAAQGISLGSMDDWISNDVCYAKGATAGRLVALKAEEIEPAFSAGNLKPDDILLATTGVPAEIPTLAGVITLVPSTPNSHVTLLAQSFKMPFVFVKDAQTRALLSSSVGKDILLDADGNGLAVNFTFGCQVAVRRVELSATDRAAVTSLREPPKINFPPAAPLGTLFRKAAEIAPRVDAKHFGGKASNMPILLGELPENSPAEAGAIAVDLWFAHLESKIDGKPLKVLIAEELAAHQAYPPANVTALKDALKRVRKAIETAPLASFWRGTRQKLSRA